MKRRRDYLHATTRMIISQRYLTMKNCEIAASTDIGMAGSAEGTVFPTSIKETKINSLFDTGATKSVMSGEMYKRLKLGPLNTTRLPKVVGADGTSLGAMGRISCEIDIGKQTF